MSSYFTEREQGSRPPTVDVVDARLWGGLHSLIDTRVGDGSFGWRFPEQCPDGHAARGCDEKSLGRVLAAEVPQVEWPLSPTEVPATPVILDVLEFCARAVGRPLPETFHPYYRHHHLRWERDEGLERFVADVNTLFRRNGLAFTLTIVGEARRLRRRWPRPSAGRSSGRLTSRRIAFSNPLGLASRPRGRMTARMPLKSHGTRSRV